MWGLIGSSTRVGQCSLAAVKLRTNNPAISSETSATSTKQHACQANSTLQIPCVEAIGHSSARLCKVSRTKRWSVRWQSWCVRLTLRTGAHRVVHLQLRPFLEKAKGCQTRATSTASQDSLAYARHHPRPSSRILTCPCLGKESRPSTFPTPIPLPLLRP